MRESEMSILLRGRRVGLGGLLFLVCCLGCGGDVDTQVRRLASGRQIEVFRVFPQEFPGGRTLNYFYFSENLSDRLKLEDEWKEVLSDAQQEAARAKAQQIILIANAKQHWFVSLISSRRSHSALYKLDGQTWHKVRED